MPLSPGTRLGVYEVAEKIGEGGMGEVYRARDTKLDRDVALKVLPDLFANDPERLGRFQREARVLASLNHPNIGSIYGLEEAEPSPPRDVALGLSEPSDVARGFSPAVRALVLELIEGPTLADLIGQGPMTIEDALPIAQQIADALEAAHEQGIIHRDLKPANVKVKDDGTVKVLDFGLAKALDPSYVAQGFSPASASPTVSLTAAATQMGMVIGTAAYMSPEQARGKPVDKRADIWAFGVVLYEMLTGARPFQGEDVSLTLASVMKSDVDPRTLPPEVPASVRTVLRRCLEKDPSQRIRDVGDVRLAMEGAFETTVDAPVEAAVATSSKPWQRPVAILGVVVAAVLLTGFAVWIVTGPAPRPLAQFLLLTPPDGPLRTGFDTEVAISPDGTRVVYASGVGPPQNRRLYLRQLGELDATPIRGTEGGYAPAFSPDGQSVGFRAVPGNPLRRVSVLGGPPTTIVEPESVEGFGWGADDAIVFGSPTGLMRVPAVGGEPEPLTTVDPDQDETAHRWPDVLPNLTGVLFTAWSGSDEESRLAVVSLETGAVSYLLTGGSHPRYAPTGHIVYGVGGTLRAVGFDPDRLELTSTNPVPVVENVTTRRSGAANFSLAGNGSLVYTMGARAAGGAPRSLVWVNREGREEPLDTPLRPYRSPSVSPDGTRVAVDVADPEGSDIWLHDLERGTETRLTTDPARDYAPLWTLDGERVVFASSREGLVALFQKLADTPGPAERVMTASDGSAIIQPTSWAAEGQTLLYWEAGRSPPTVGVVSLEEDRGTGLLLNSAFAEAAPAVSPDGVWIAYQSNETGQAEVYVQRFPMLGGKRTISTAGGRQPLWSPDGSELFYRAPDGMMVVAVLDTEPVFRAGSPAVLFETQYYFDRSLRTYDLHPDGQRFLMVKADALTEDSGTSSSPQIVLIENWFDELKRLVPVP